VNRDEDPIGHQVNRTPSRFVVFLLEGCVACGHALFVGRVNLNAQIVYRILKPK
jgi:hypothetical protein